MKDQRKTNIKVGITFLLSLIILIWIISWAKNISFTDTHKVIVVSFNSVSGLSTNDIVTVNGVKKGYVENISLKNNISYVKIKIENDVELTQGTKYYVMMLDLMGGKKIEIIPGNSNIPINFNEIQQGEFSGDVATAMAFVGNLQQDVNSLLEKLNLTLDNLNNSVLNKRFTDRAENLLSDANSLIRNLNVVLKENEKSIKELITNANSTIENTNQLLGRNESNIDSLLTNINVTVRKSNKLISNLDSLAKETIEKKNNIGKLLYDENLMNDLKETLKSVKELTGILVEQMKKKGIKVDAYIF
jgi:phospholipid/cholesterol/gamma-HCH transport system substrate-binding protein